MFICGKDKFIKEVSKELIDIFLNKFKIIKDI